MEMQEERFARDFPVEPGFELKVENVTGRIVVRAWDEERVHVSGVKRWREGSDPRDTDVEMWQDGQRIWIRTRPRRFARWLDWLLGQRTVEVDYEIQVPRQGKVSTRQVNGPTEVEGVQGEVRVEAVNGPVTLRDLQGEVGVKSVSGEVTAERLVGPLRLGTVSGDAVVRSSELSALRLDTVSGDALIETPLTAEGSYQGESVSGSLHLVVPADTRCTVRSRTVSGGVRCLLPHRVVRQGWGTWEGEVNGGGVAVEWRSVSGGVVIATEASAPGEAAEEEASPSAGSQDTAEARLAILRAVEAGEMDVDEAVRRLEEL